MPVARRARNSRRALALLGAGLACGCRPAAPQPNFLFIVVDTLRADALGCYGSRRPTSPAIDELARAGTRFDRAYSTAPWTKPAIASMLTGKFPSAHGAQGFQRVLPQEIDTLAETLGRHGYATAGVVSHRLVARSTGLAQGFEVYRDDQARGPRYVSTPGVAGEARDEIARLARGRRPFFLFVHFFDPHADYLRHAEFGFAPARAGRLDATQPMSRLREWMPGLTAEELAFVRALYDEEVRAVDGGVALLLGELERQGVSKDTWIVVTSDHGEELGQRGWLEHTRTLHEELVRVPLIVKRGRGARPSPVVDTAVSTVSIAPTLLQAAGLPPRPEEARFGGPSLVPALDGLPLASAPLVFFEVDFPASAPGDPAGRVLQRGMLRRDLKVIENLRARTLAAFDLRSDPGETVDLLAASPHRAAGLREELARAAGEAARGGVAGGEEQYDAETLELLRSLGYVGSLAPRAPAPAPAAESATSPENAAERRP